MFELQARLIIDFFCLLPFLCSHIQVILWKLWMKISFFYPFHKWTYIQNQKKKEFIKNYLQNHFLHPPWLAEKQPITSCYPQICCITTCMSILQINILFKLWHQQCNTESRRLPKLVMSPNSEVHTKVILQGYSTHMGTQNSPTSNLWICKDQPPKLQGTKRTVTRMNAIAKSADNTSFCNYSSFSWYFFKYKLFFQPNCCLVTFLLFQ